jgi:hypothetical protein
VTTTIVRADPWEANIKTADIRWPKIMPAKSKGKNPPDGVLVRLKGSRWKGGDSFLQHSASKKYVVLSSRPISLLNILLAGFANLASLITRIA